MTLSILKYLGKKDSPVDTGEAYAEWLIARGAYITQRCTLEYCRLKAALNWDKLLKEEAFLSAFEVCRWEAYGVILADVIVVGEERLRANGEISPHRTLEFACRTYRSGLERYPVPAHREDGWAHDLEAFSARVALAQGAPAKAPHLHGFKTGTHIYHHLPVHPRLRLDDEELIQNNVRINLARFYEDLREKVDIPAVAADLTGRPRAEG